jgi:hypothetical protein
MLAAVAACTSTAKSNDAVLEPGGRHDPRVEEACKVTAETCSRCHDWQKVVVAHFDQPMQWRDLVLRMRRMPGSGITDEEVREAETCLVYRDFGPRGLAELAGAGAAR